MSASETVVEALEAFIQRRLSEVNTCMPARIHSFDRTTGTAEVVPLLAQTVLLLDGTEQDRYLPLIKNVQIFTLGSGPIEITFPLQVGSLVTIIFSQVSLDRWKSSLTPEIETDTGNTRRFDPSDAIAFPSLRTIKNPSTQIHETDLVLACPGMRLGDISAEDGSVRLSDLEALKTAIVTAIASGTTGGDGGIILLGKVLENWTPSASSKVKLE